VLTFYLRALELDDSDSFSI